MKVQPETIDDKWNDTHKHYYNTTQPLSSWVPNCFSISCNILWNTTSTSCEQWVCVWVCVSEWVSECVCVSEWVNVCMWVSACITILPNNPFSLSLSSLPVSLPLFFCFLFSLIYTHTHTNIQRLQLAHLVLFGWRLNKRNIPLVGQLLSHLKRHHSLHVEISLIPHKHNWNSVKMDRT